MPDHDITLVDCTLAHVKILTAIHNECFDNAWSAPEFKTLLETPAVFGCIVQYQSEPAGFILCRMVADECKILKLGVRPPYRWHGIADRLLEKLILDIKRLKIAKIFLEVAETNEVALNLYNGKDFIEFSRRENDYNNPDGRIDAFILAKNTIISQEYEQKNWLIVLNYYR